MSWILASRKNSKIDLEKLIKMALVHDLCDVYSGGMTPYDSILPKNKKKRQKLLKTWPRFSDEERKNIAEDKFKKEEESLEKLVKDLPPKLKQEMKNLWLDSEKGLSREGRFLKHADRIESFLQASEYWKNDKKFPLGPFWTEARELHDDPVLLEFIGQIDREFHGGKKAK
jgi:putative hydrolase of HD superfamily